MAYNLLPVEYDTEKDLAVEDLEEESTVRYPNGIAFNYESGDFCRDGKNKLMDSNGIESLKSWCIDCVHTERYKHLAYGDGYGIDLDAVFEAETREEAESVLVREVTEALLADPYQRILYVSEVECTWQAPDSVSVHIIIQGVDDATIDITVYLTKGGT